MQQNDPQPSDRNTQQSGRPTFDIKSFLRTYLLVISSVVLTTLIRYSLNSVLGRRAAFIAYFPALVFSAWRGGWGGGVLALVLSTLAATYYFITPTHAFFVTARSDQITLIVFVIVGLSVSALSSAQRRASQQAEEAAEAARRSETALRESEDRYSHLLEIANEGVITIDTDDRISFVNLQMAQMLGYVANDLIGHPLYDLLFPEDAVRARERRGQRQQGVPEQYELRLRHKEGHEIWTVANVTVIQEKGRYAGTFSLMTDITERKRIEWEREHLLEDLQAERTRLRLALQSGGLGTWHLDLVTGEFLNISDTCKANFGVSLTADFSYTDLLTAVPPEDHIQLQEAVEQAIISHVDYQAEYRVFWPDQSLHWISASGAPIYDAEGNGIRMIGVTVDITPRKEAEALRLAQAEREHQIAEQLQTAIQPSIPVYVPGLALAKHYEAALAEAGVGGDFFDVFPLEKGCTVIVVGDVSGKGLTAAVQVATLRNMLRFAIYNRVASAEESSSCLADAVFSLNRTLAQNALLSGFATLFVGVYDSGARTLTYVNCGQEPGLVRRKDTGVIEPLPPSGPILGGDENAVFEEGSIPLAPGDAFAVFTDGATEVGPTRQALLGIDGVASLLEQPLSVDAKENSAQIAEALTRRLVEGINTHAREGVRDDICLITAVVEGGTYR